MKRRTRYSEPLFFTAPELIVDNFAGGGGASTGIAQALGRDPDIAVNHDTEAILMHMANHPDTRHYCENVWRIDPVEATAGRPVGLMWMSPDCKHFSKAKGGRPVEKKIRGLAWVGVKWAKRVHPRVIVLENVEEFQEWGPIADDGRPCPIRKGQTFKAFVAALKRLGYAVDWRELRACDYGAPTTRKRLFLIARCDGSPITWPLPTHGPGRLPYRTAASCIDWSIPCPSIFERKRPLAPATMRRIARGVMKYVVNSPEPFIVGLAHGTHKERPGTRSHSIHEPLRTIDAGGGNHAVVAPVIARIGQTGGNGDYSNDVRTPLTTITTKAEHLLVVPTLINTRNGEREGQAPRCLDINQPYTTVTALGSQGALVAAFLAKHNGVGEKMVVGQSLTEPTHTITATDQKALVAANIVKLRGGGNIGQSADEPLRTISAGGTHFAAVHAFLLKYYGTEQDPRIEEPLSTVTTKDRFALVTVRGEEYAIVDIGMRMLTPRELFRAQGFPDSYIIGDDPAQGVILTKSAQVRMCGNSVCPPLAKAIVEANCVETAEAQEAA